MQDHSCEIIHLHPKATDSRAYPRVVARFTVHLETDEELVEVHSMDISQGGAFLVTNKVISNGTEVALFFIHPVDEEEVLIHGKVIRQGRSDHPGVGVSFNDAGSAKAKQLMDFISKDELKNIGPRTLEQVIVDSAWVANG